MAGQDGSYLAELLLDRGYEVFGDRARLAPCRVSESGRGAERHPLLQGDLLDQMTLLDAITRAEPDELYNLAATSFVPASWRQPVMTAQFTAVGVTSMLEAVRITKPDLRVYQASTSEMFGATPSRRSTSRRRSCPHNPYAVAKLYGHLMVSTYRERYGMHASSRDPLQPRVAAPPAGVRQPQGHPDRGGDQARSRRRAAPRRSRGARATGASPATSPRRCG